MKAMPSQVTILPAQFRYLAKLADETRAAVGVSQMGSVLFINTGITQFAINAQGKPLNKKEEDAQKVHYLRNL